MDKKNGTEGVLIINSFGNMTKGIENDEWNRIQRKISWCGERSTWTAT